MLRQLPLSVFPNLSNNFFSIFTKYLFWSHQTIPWNSAAKLIMCGASVSFESLGHSIWSPCFSRKPHFELSLLSSVSQCRRQRSEEREREKNGGCWGFPATSSLTFPAHYRLSHTRNKMAFYTVTLFIWNVNEFLLGVAWRGSKQAY